MGAEVREALRSRGVSQYLHDLEEGMQSYSVFAPYIPTPRHRRRDAARKEMGKFFSEILAERRKCPTESKHVDMIDKLLNAAYSPSGQKLSDEEITGMCIAAFFGGMHNSAITSAWTLIYIHNDRKLLARLRAEQKEACGESGHKMDYKSLSAMPLLKACVKEALRLTPPLVLLMRTVMKPITACGYTIAPGTVVATCPPVAHRIESLYPDPEAFTPDRWTEKVDKDIPHSFIAFGDGARRCLGEHFGYLQVMTIVSHCLQHYDLEVLDGIPKAGFQGMVCGPEGGCRAKFRLRSETA
eukprot:gnl/TRDRNA2_/TRDRNA2_145094_c2_seq1.p1 gnl/TRDRNA2_/TRDRNA2_145094_c2~~gnl/TRDRNA2_/TRDRNA2_145094_c2_seq1.p1  ORF type:complete len:310 (+),score=27.32 gnl/TRDRNA2_/TRDRNA2_145094_c2_seq1:37-930(+)